ncbi:hypothetical protein ACHAXN_009494 [Cyclotella atomus]
MNPPQITIPPLPPNLYLHHTTLLPRPKLILIGDSITEQGSLHANGWVTSLSIRYNRRLDVLNRGTNGYNSNWGKHALKLILEDVCGSADAIQSTTADTIQSTADTYSNKYPQCTFLIGYGANDSCLPTGSCHRHHVPIDDYSDNLRDMIQMIQSYHCQDAAAATDETPTKTTSKVAIGLITPPPVDTSIQFSSRDNTITKLYAEAVMLIGQEMNVPVVDLWNGMQKPVRFGSRGDGACIMAHDSLFDKDGNNSTDIFDRKHSNNDECTNTEYGTRWKQEYLSDGLHLTPMGNYRMFELVVEMLEKEMGLTVENVPRQYPDHSLVNAEFPDRSFVQGT